ATSRDLVRWSKQQTIPVMTAFHGVRNSWAPEMTYDATAREFVIMWSSSIDGRFGATPGKSSAVTEYDFKGKLTGETSDAQDDTVGYYLETSNVDSIGEGDPVIFRGLKVGTVSRVSLNKSGQLGTIQVNIQTKYRHLVRTNTAFWRKVAIQADLGLFKSQIKINSLESLLKGGIEFFTPDDPGPVSKALAKFPLSPAAPKDYEKWNPKLD
ncbi:MAG: MCE family protein, partial [Proteobacteria bacterium]